MVDKPKNSSRSAKIEIGFLEGVRRRCPKHRMILEALGDLYTRIGRYDDGLNVDLELTLLHPDESIAWYNLGCSLALVGRQDDAFEALFKAVELGYKDYEWINKDGDLESLRSDPRFMMLLNRARKDGRKNTLSKS